MKDLRELKDVTIHDLQPISEMLARPSGETRDPTPHRIRSAGRLCWNAVVQTGTCVAVNGWSLFKRREGNEENNDQIVFADMLVCLRVCA